MLRRGSMIALLALGILACSPADAALPQGSRAPQVVSAGGLGGNDYHFDLAAALRRGPVVLYFFPKAFTSGCTAEAHAFAAAMDQFTAAGASVVGLSNDDVPTLKRFSQSECSNRFPVVQASPATIRAWGVALPGSDLASRTSYVIGRDGRIVFVHSDMDWRQHVTLTLAAVKRLRGKR